MTNLQQSKISNKDCLVLRKFLVDTVKSIDNIVDSDDMLIVKNTCYELLFAFNEIASPVESVNKNTGHEIPDSNDIRLFNLNNLNKLAQHDEKILNLLRAIQEYEGCYHSGDK